jgi:hypothetical protein
MPTEKLVMRTEEKLTIEMSRDGVLQTFDLAGMTTLRIAEESVQKVRIFMHSGEKRGAQLQTHPNLDKEAFKNKGVLALKNPTKPFPLHNEVGVLKWRIQGNDESLVPMTVNCWPTESGAGCDVNIEYSLEMSELELHDVIISIPLPPGANPVIKDCDGDYKHERVRNTLEWKLAVVDKNNKSGTLEFSTSSGHPDNFFPVRVSFRSNSQFCEITPSEVTQEDDGSAVKFAYESVLLVDRFEIV